MEPKIKQPKIKRPKAPTAKAAAGKLKKAFGISFIYCFVFIILFLLGTFIVGDQNSNISTFRNLQIYCLVLGIIHCFTQFHVLKIFRFVSRKSIILTILLTAFSMVSLFISHNIGFLPTIPGYFALGGIAFCLPWLVMVAFEIFLQRPRKIFQQWFYPYGKEIPVIEVIDPISVKFYIAKQKSDEDYNEFSLNVPPKYPIAEFMHYFLHRYNYDKNPQSPIFISPDNSDKNLYGWIFRAKAAMGKYRILDPSKSFIEQNLQANSEILVDRYSPQYEEFNNAKMKVSVDINQEENLKENE